MCLRCIQTFEASIDHLEFTLQKFMFYSHIYICLRYIHIFEASIVHL